MTVPRVEGALAVGRARDRAARAVDQVLGEAFGLPVRAARRAVRAPVTKVYLHGPSPRSVDRTYATATTVGACLGPVSRC